jgi:hyperosmotically inducible periplasmic protein
MTTRHFTVSTLAVSLLAASALSACSRTDQDTVGRQVDRTIVHAQQEAARAGADASRAVEKAKQAADQATSKAATAVSDASITTTINAELARDAALDPSKIDVDTAQGRVVLRGSAPDDAAKERAKRIALAVNGVRGVDNYLSVGSHS